MEKRVWWKQKKFWFSAIGVLFLVMVITMLLGKNVSTVRIQEEKISISTISEGIFNLFWVNSPPLAANIIDSRIPRPLAAG